MNACLIHRGPHSDGFYYDRNLGLAMRRLKVIDLETGDQPILNETEDVVVTFNGEIYNFELLRKDLESKGHSFKSRADTEVLVHGYEEWGIRELLSRLNGMYAFSIYDKKQRLLYLARDRIGEKPLYYYRDKDNFVYASELQAILESGMIPLKISQLALYSYLCVHYVPGDLCIIENVNKLLPGHYLEFDLKKFSVKVIQYWDLEERKFKERENVDYIAYTKKLVEDSIKLRLVSDVPLGVFLSGGIDSSVIVSVMKKLQTNINTFSIGFEEPEFDETKYVDMIVKKFGTNHHHFLFKSDQVAELLPEVIKYMDEPVGDQALLPVYWLSHEAKKHVTVVLGGEGGDEIFAGYSYYQNNNDEKNKESQSESQLEILDDFIQTKKAETSSGFPLITDFEIRCKLIKNFDTHKLQMELQNYNWLEKLKNGLSNIGDSLRRRQYVDIKTWLPDDLLMKFDKMSMSTSLEGRAPFLDYRLVEFVFNLPEKYKIKNNESKVILRKAFQSELPQEIFLRKKQGFNLPMSKWLRTNLKQYLDEIIKLELDDHIDNDYLKILIDEHVSGKAERGRFLYAVLVYKLWVKSIFERYGRIRK